MINKFFNKYTVTLYVAVLMLLMLLPMGDYGLQNPIADGELGDYIVHFIVFLPWMFCGNIIPQKLNSSKRWFLLGALFVVLLELAQMILPYRSYNFLDILAGELGLIVSLIMFSLYKRYLKK